MGMCTVTIGTFLCVPSVITYDKSTVNMKLIYVINKHYTVLIITLLYATVQLFHFSQDFNTLRIVCIVGWVLLGWVYEYGVSQQTDLFCRQIDKTKLLCTYIQLKPSSSGKVTNRML